MRKRKCYYCGFPGGKMRPSIAMLGAWVCRDRDACDRRINVKSPFLKG